MSPMITIYFLLTALCTGGVVIYWLKAHKKEKSDTSNQGRDGQDGHEDRPGETSFKQKLSHLLSRIRLAQSIRIFASSKRALEHERFERSYHSSSDPSQRRSITHHGVSAGTISRSEDHEDGGQIELEPLRNEYISVGLRRPEDSERRSNSGRREEGRRQSFASRSADGFDNVSIGSETRGPRNSLEGMESRSWRDRSKARVHRWRRQRRERSETTSANEEAVAGAEYV